VSEKKLRQLDISFRYDKRGTLYNGSEPNIAFRITTFKAMLDGLAHGLGKDTLRDVLIKVGEKAASDFASKVDTIYDKNVFEHGGLQIGLIYLVSRRLMLGRNTTPRRDGESLLLYFPEAKIW
jgi:hypothetical protein